MRNTNNNLVFQSVNKKLQLHTSFSALPRRNAKRKEWAHRLGMYVFAFYVSFEGVAIKFTGKKIYWPNEFHGMQAHMLVVAVRWINA